MNQPSVFQGQYPLSPRKFWKKILPSLIGYIIFIIIVLIVLYFINKGIQMDGTPEALNIQHWIPIIIGGVLAFYLILTFLRSWYIKAYIKRYYYDCGDQFITIKKGVFAPTEIHVQYQKIQDVYVDQDILDRIMGLYDVHIASATVTSGIEAHIDGVNADVAENLKNIILNKIHNSGTPSNPQAGLVPQPPQQQAVPIQFNQKISSDTYPISGKWVISVLGSSLVFSLIYTLIFTRFFFVLGPAYIFIAFGVIFFLHIIYLAIWKSNFYFEFTPDYILLRTGVISRSENHLPYKSIQNVINNQGILDRILGLSTVTIQNAAQQMIQTRGGSQAVGSGIRLIWQPKDKAEELNNIINDIVTKISPQNSSGLMGV